MNWTTTPPTKPGAYWWRANEKDAFPELAEVSEAQSADGAKPLLIAVFCGDDGDGIPITKPKSSGEWCGPLVPLDVTAEKMMDALKTVARGRVIGDRNDLSAMLRMQDVAQRAVEGNE